MGISNYKLIRTYWSEVPNRDITWKNNEISKVGEDIFRNEYELIFSNVGHTDKPNIIKVDKIYYEPEVILSKITIDSVEYTNYDYVAKIFVISDIDTYYNNIKFAVGKITYTLKDCIYTKVKDKLHIKCKYFIIGLIE